MRLSERYRLQYVEAHAKRYKWRSVAFVGVADAKLVRQFLCNFTACSVLAVPMWADPETLRPSERDAQRVRQKMLHGWARSYAARYTLDEGPPEKVAGRVEQFDGVVLWDAISEELLPSIGGAWVGRVKDGGWLMGVDWRSPAVRDVLDAVAPGRWEHFREGIWGVRVRRALAGGVAAADTEVGGQDASQGLDPEHPAVDGDRRPAPDAHANPALTAHDDAPAAEPVIAPKRRGRPPGSRNKVAA